MANCQKERASAVLAKMAVEADKLGIQLIAADETANLLPGCTSLDLKEMFDRVEAVVVLGGDGSMLSAVRKMAGIGKPLMGVNIGSLGFMTSVAEKDLVTALECIKNDKYVTSERTLADCTVIHEGDSIARYHALNDIVIRNGESSRIITLGVTIDDKTVTSYSCDGLVVSTPTGSTGHSLSAGGPILMPQTNAFVISLICPHTLNSRPIVIQDKSKIALRVDDENQRVVLSVDGQVGRALEYSDQVLITRSDRKVTFLHLPGYNYFAVLRQKLHWSGSNV